MSGLETSAIANLQGTEATLRAGFVALVQVLKFSGRLGETELAAVEAKMRQAAGTANFADEDRRKLEVEWIENLFHGRG